MRNKKTGIWIKEIYNALRCNVCVNDCVTLSGYYFDLCIHHVYFSHFARVRRGKGSHVGSVEGDNTAYISGFILSLLVLCVLCVVKNIVNKTRWRENCASDFKILRVVISPSWAKWWLYQVTSCKFISCTILAAWNCTLSVKSVISERYQLCVCTCMHFLIWCKAFDCKRL